MKKLFPLIVLLLAVGIAASALRPLKNPGAFDVIGFGKLPVLVNGRINPIDTVARCSLLQIQGRQPVSRPDGHDLLPIESLLDGVFRPNLADAYQTFEIVNPDLLAIFNLKTEEGQGG